MIGLDPKTLATMRSIQTAYMADTVQIGTVGTTKDRYGSESETFVLATTVKGQLSQPTASEARLLEPLRNQGILGEETQKLTLPYGSTLTTNHLIKTADGRTWQVIKADTTPAQAVQVEAFITIRTVRPR